MQRTVLGFDFGTRSIGTAIGQEITATARPLVAVPVRKGQPHWQQIATLFTTWQPDLVVVGLPLNMDGTEQPLTRLARQFADQLQQWVQQPIVLHDERLSTVEARSRLFQQGGYRALTKKQIDTLSATIILESWFSVQSPIKSLTNTQTDQA